MATKLTTFYSPTASGAALAFAAVDATGNTFSNDGKVLVIIKTLADATQTVTVATPGTFRGQTITAVATGTLAASTVRVMGPFPPDVFNDTSTGLVTLTYGGTTPATYNTIALVRIP